MLTPAQERYALRLVARGMPVERAREQARKPKPPALMVRKDER